MLTQEEERQIAALHTKLIHAEFSTRLGAMAAAEAIETIVEKRTV